MYPTAIGSEPDFPNFDSQPSWQRVMLGHAVANGVFIAAANRIGFEGLITFYGTSFIADPLGNKIVEAARDKSEVLVGTLDFEVFQLIRKLFPLLHQRQPQNYGQILQTMQ